MKLTACFRWLRSLGKLLKEAVGKWVDDGATRLSAATAFYVLFALAPLVVIGIAVAGFFFGEAAARNQIVGVTRNLLGQRGAEVVQGVIHSAHTAGGDIWAVLIGIVTLFIGSTSLFAQLQDSLNAIWHVRPKPGRPVHDFLRQRVLAFIMVLLIAIMLLVSVILSAVLTIFSQILPELPISLYLLYAVDIVLSVSIVGALLGAIYKLLPDVKITWRDVWFGSALTSFLIVLGKFGIGLYLAHAGATTAYGAAGSLVAVLFWVYYSSMIFFFGAEFTYVFARHRGRTIMPAKHAERVRHVADQPVKPSERQKLD